MFVVGMVVLICAAVSSHVPFLHAQPVLWLDGSDVNGDGSSVSNGASISTWKNKGSLGATGDVSAPTTDQQPTYDSSGLSGSPGVRFDGLNSDPGDNTIRNEATADVLQSSTVSDWNFLTDGTSYSVFAVVNVSDPIANGWDDPSNSDTPAGSQNRISGVFGNGDGSSGADLLIWEPGSNISNSGDRPQYAIIPGPGGPPVRGGDVANNDAAVYRLTYNGGNIDMGHNGTVHASKGGFFPVIGPQAVLDVGARGEQRDKLEGVMAELIMFNQELTTDQLIGLEQLIGDFHGITVANMANAQQIADANALFLNGYKATSAPPTEFTWNLNGLGSWMEPGNWNPASSPNNPNHTVIFADAISVDATVVVDTPVTVNRIQFNNTNNTYNVAGLGTVNLGATTDPTSPVDPSLSVQGVHRFQAAVQLDASTLADVASDSSLTFDGAVNLSGMTLTKTGAVIHPVCRIKEAA